MPTRRPHLKETIDKRVEGLIAGRPMTRRLPYMMLTMGDGTAAVVSGERYERELKRMDEAHARAYALVHTRHAIQRFMERGGREACNAVKRSISGWRGASDEEFFCATLSSSIAMSDGTSRDFLDSKGEKVELLPLVTPAPGGKGMADLPLIAVIKDDAVVTVLSKEMVKQNLLTGFYRMPDGSPVPLTQKLREALAPKPPPTPPQQPQQAPKKESDPMSTDYRTTYDWALEYFRKASGKASVHGALKAANNSRAVPLIQEAFRDARQTVLAELAQNAKAQERVEAEVEENWRRPAAQANAVQPAVAVQPEQEHTNMAPTPPEVRRTAPQRQGRRTRRHRSYCEAAGRGDAHPRHERLRHHVARGGRRRHRRRVGRLLQALRQGQDAPLSHVTPQLSNPEKEQHHGPL